MPNVRNENRMTRTTLRFVMDIPLSGRSRGVERRGWFAENHAQVNPDARRNSHHIVEMHDLPIPTHGPIHPAHWVPGRIWERDTNPKDFSWLWMRAGPGWPGRRAATGPRIDNPSRPEAPPGWNRHARSRCYGRWPGRDRCPWTWW